MNEGDSAGGHIGRSPAPPAVTDRRSNTSGSVQVSCFLYKIVILSVSTLFFFFQNLQNFLSQKLFVCCAIEIIPKDQKRG